MGADVTARVTGAEAGNSSLTVLCEMYQGEKLTVKGKAVLVYMDVKTKAPARLPEQPPNSRTGQAKIRGGSMTFARPMGASAQLTNTGLRLVGLALSHTNVNRA